MPSVQNTYRSPAFRSNVSSSYVVPGNDPSGTPGSWIGRRHPFAAPDRIGQARIRHHELPLLEVERGVAQHAEIFFELPLVQNRVHRREHARRARSNRGEAPAERPRADELAGKGAIERRRHSLARHVADGNDERARVGGQVVVQVAADLPRRLETCRELDALQALRRFRRQQRTLHAARKFDFALEAKLARSHRLVQPRVLDRHRGLAGENAENLSVALRERAELGAFEIEHADDTGPSAAAARPARIGRRPAP